MCVATTNPCPAYPYTPAYTSYPYGSQLGYGSALGAAGMYPYGATGVSPYGALGAVGVNPYGSYGTLGAGVNPTLAYNRQLLANSLYDPAVFGTGAATRPVQLSIKYVFRSF